MSHNQDAYTFQFDALNNTVLAMREVDGRKSKLQKLSDSTFQATTGTNDLNVEAVVEVTRTKLSKGFTQTTVYADQDGDQLFSETFEIQVASAAVAGRRLEQHKFTFDAAGEVTSELSLKKGLWKADHLDANEHFDTVQLGGVNYIVKTEQEHQGVEFEIFRDDNADGIWTQIAKGETASLYLDPVTGGVDLVGIQSFLAAADTIVG